MRGWQRPRSQPDRNPTGLPRCAANPPRPLDLATNGHGGFCGWVVRSGCVCSMLVWHAQRPRPRTGPPPGRNPPRTAQQSQPTVPADRRRRACGHKSSSARGPHPSTSASSTVIAQCAQVGQNTLQQVTRRTSTDLILSGAQISSVPLFSGAARSCHCRGTCRAVPCHCSG